VVRNKAESLACEHGQSRALTRDAVETNVPGIWIDDTGGDTK
jgi:hypothetical protein